MSGFLSFEKDVLWIKSFASKRRFDNYVVYCFVFDNVEYKYIGFRTFNQFMKAESFAYYWSKQERNNMSRLELMQGSARVTEFINGSRCVY